mgnify:CR=1 FL=1
MELKHLFDAWTRIAFRYSRGEHIDRADLEKALESGEPMPANLNPLMLEVIRGRPLAKRGNRKMATVAFAEEMERLHGLISALVNEFAAYIENTTAIPDDWPHETKVEIQQHARQIKSKRRRRAAGTASKGPRERAYEMVATRFDIAPSTCKKIATGACL